MKITVETAAIKKKLRALPGAFNEKVMTSVNRQAGKVLVEKEKMLAPEGPNGWLVDSIGIVKESKKKRLEVGAVVIGPRRRGGYKGFHAHLVEFGTKIRQTLSGANRGKMPKEPFIKPSLKAVGGKMIENAKRLLKPTFDRFVKKLG